MATLRANISGEEHDIDNRGNGAGNYEVPPTPYQNFMNFGPLTA